MSQGTAKQMVEFLVDKYIEAMEAQNAAGQNPPFAIEVMVGNLQSFRQFVVEYLKLNQPQQLITNLDGNYGVQLTNLEIYTVGVPVAEMKGTMQPSQHVGVTGAQTAADMQAAGAVPLTGHPQLIPPGAVDFTKPGEARDMTVQQPQVRYDQQHPGNPAS